ncbi:MAG TPA: PQQ-dependent sugar dehydrogenase, partial [Solirubrobacterales bacterium]|nr:PQQ-dependent sugar dehydrogenase [Solirubrobacterales bacterium]
MALRATTLLALALAFPAAAEAKPKLGDGRGGVELRKLGEFDSPVHLDNAPGSRRLLFVVEQQGTIRVLRRKRTLATPFLDIRGRVECCGEEGLLSVAFAPDYKQSGRFYVYYTARGGDINRVAEFRRSTATTADPASARTVIEFAHPAFSNHNGGQLQFGPDGHLYIAAGDGGGGGDPDGNGQNPNSPLGKLLRVAPRSVGTPYVNPEGNPFVGSPGLNEVYALGLRNPWRFSFDRKTGRISIADVGQGAWEEVNYETPSGLAGANFGWNAFEGTHRFDTRTPAPPDHRAPIHEYENGGNCAVVGGYVVRDRELKSLYGRYLYADHCAGKLRSFVPKLSGARKDRPLEVDVPSPTSFGEGVKGRIYV